MKLRTLYFSILALSALLCACEQDPTIDQSKESDGLVRLTIDARTSLGSQVGTHTRATDQDITGNVVVLVCDAKSTTTALVKQPPVTPTVNTATKKMMVTLQEQSTPCFLLVFANITNESRDYLLALPIDTPLADVSRRITFDVPAAGLALPAPMSGWSGQLAAFKKGDTPTATVELVRALAGINVTTTSTVFQIQGVQLVNGAKRGYVTQQQVIPFYGSNDVVNYPMKSFTPAVDSYTGDLFLCENRCVQGNAIYPTRVVIYGKRPGASNSTYYGIDIVYSEGIGTSAVNAYYIQRNNTYTIKLNKVNIDGYTTYDEAVRGVAFNNSIDANIVVSDPNAYVVDTNGQQYLGLTNSECVLYPYDNQEQVRNLYLGTISYTCHSSWSVGSITASTGITVLNGMDRLEIYPGVTPTFKDVIVHLDPTFKSGIVTISIGNLTQTIKVRKNNSTNPAGQIGNDYFVADATTSATSFKKGEVILPTTSTSWLKLSTSDIADVASALRDQIVNPAGGVYFHAEPYLSIDKGDKYREASFYTSGETPGQRIRVIVQQKSYNFSTESKQITPLGFVGTFHRWDQTAERIIRMDAPAGITWWVATIASGVDFIALCHHDSPDTGITRNLYGQGNNPIYTTDEQIEDNCQLSDQNLTVSGNATNNIFFRVGLRSRLSGPNATPRYGLITISYGNESLGQRNTLGVHNIYVRQGETADYLMRPSDPSTSSDFVANTRPKAVRVSPYNLTDVSVGANAVDRGARGYYFTQYPSQGGYYFLASGTQAINPTVTGLATGLLTPPPFNITLPWPLDQSYESCPKGYRRPADGLARAFSTVQSANDVSDSELRQSLMLNPSKGAQRNVADNQLAGYIADGYFDRRPIALLATPNPNMPNGVVSASSVDAAYCGILSFNPYNFASVFHPFAGKYLATGGASELGNSATFQLATAGSTDLEGWVVRSNTATGSYLFNIDKRTSLLDGFSIRCVRDESPLIDSDDSYVEKPGDGGTLTAVSMLYTDTLTTSLQQQVESRYKTVAERQKINNLALNAAKTLTGADYKYLNDWASDPSQNLRHLIVRGKGSESLPTNAFTSSNWRTITLIDSHTLASGAFASTTAPSEISLHWPQKLARSATAFANTANPNTVIYIGIGEYNSSDRKSNVEWPGGYTWKGVNLIP